jgi:hypothetical protein
MATYRRACTTHQKDKTKFSRAPCIQSNAFSGDCLKQVQSALKTGLLTEKNVHALSNNYFSSSDFLKLDSGLCEISCLHHLETWCCLPCSTGTGHRACTNNRLSLLITCSAIFQPFAKRHVAISQAFPLPGQRRGDIQIYPWQFVLFAKH